MINVAEEESMTYRGTIAGVAVAFPKASRDPAARAAHMRKCFATLALIKSRDPTARVSYSKAFGKRAFKIGDKTYVRAAGRQITGKQIPPQYLEEGNLQPQSKHYPHRSRVPNVECVASDVRLTDLIDVGAGYAIAGRSCWFGKLVCCCP